MAEREGFEPSVVLLLHTLTKRPDQKVRLSQRFFKIKNYLLIKIV